ncbi:MAG: hypothetical protein RIC35_08995 [Marinoscillum sp.]
MKWKTFYILVVMSFAIACDEIEDPFSGCILESIQFDSYNRLEFMTLSGGMVYQVRQVYEYEDEYKTLASFQFTYYQDSIVVKDQLEPGKLPYLTVSLANDLPIQVVKYFPSADVQIIHDFTYSDEFIRIDLTRLASNGESLHAAYAFYHMNKEGNVERIERYEIESENLNNFEKVEDRSFVYDFYNNPFKGLFLPFFANSELPDIKFFSKNNILDIQEQNQVYRYTYQYGEEKSTRVLTDPNGQSVEFSYLNCP